MGSKGEHLTMDILSKIDFVLNDEITTSDVSQNKGKGSVDVIGGTNSVNRRVASIGYQCPKGQTWDKKTRTCIPVKNESIKKKGFFELGRKVNSELLNMHVMTLRPKDSDFSKVSKKMRITKKEAIRAWNFFTWGDEYLLPESSVVGATYVSGNSTIAGSGQTRVWGASWKLVDALQNKEKVEDEMDDKAKENLSRPNLKFNTLLGAYIPQKSDKIDTNQMENDDE